MSPVASSALIAVLVVVEVGMWQYRVALANRGRRRPAAVLGAIDALIYVTVLAQVLGNLDRPMNVAGYAIGVGAGVYLGCLADERTRREPVEYRLVAPHGDGDLLGELRSRGWPVTAMPAAALEGSADVLFVAVAAAHTRQFESILQSVAPDVFWTSSRLRSANVVTLPAGYIPLAGPGGRRRRPATS